MGVATTVCTSRGVATFVHFWSFLGEVHSRNAVNTFFVMLVDDAINHAIHPILKCKQTADKNVNKTPRRNMFKIGKQFRHSISSKTMK